MSDACCGGDAPEAVGPGESIDPVRLRDVRELRIAGAAGVLVLLGFLVPLLGGPLATGSGVAAHLAAAALGGVTFVPGAVRGLRRRRVGVATLMTIALIGALVLGQVAEAAMLAFLFSISEALEHYSVTRTRRGLRSLLALVPTEVSVEPCEGAASSGSAPAAQRSCMTAWRWASLQCIYAERDTPSLARHGRKHGRARRDKRALRHPRKELWPTRVPCTGPQVETAKFV